MPVMETSDLTPRQYWEQVKANPNRAKFGFGDKAAIINIDMQRAYTELFDQPPTVNGATTWPAMMTAPALQELGEAEQSDLLLDAIDGPPLVLVLDGIQDPHNLGACLRSADAAGVGLVILPKDRSAGLTPAARRAAAGAAEMLPIVFVTNLARVLKRLKDRGVWLAGTSNQAEQSLYDADLSGPLALVVGSEGRGMRRLTEELCDYRISIPMQGSVGSLNVSVATAVCLFEIVRRRSRP